MRQAACVRVDVAFTLAALLLLPARATGAESVAAVLGSVASIENLVETKRSTAPAYALAVLRESLAERDRIRTGPASRAAILYTDGTLQRLNQDSEVELRAPQAGGPGILNVIAGEHYFLSRSPRTFRQIQTPLVTAGIEGTEFVVSVAADSTTTITMLEGVVAVSNSFGALVVTRGEQAYVERGKAPVLRILVRPRDAVAWSLYYPPVLGGSDRQRLKDLGREGDDLARAAALLSAGQVAQAQPLIEDVRSRQPGNPLALALASVIRLAANEKDEALRLAQTAAAADPSSPAATLALSFAAQASFDIARARAMAEKAAGLDPQSSVALARAAELRMAEGDLRGALTAVDQAVARTPGDGRALAVRGFVLLAQLRSTDAEQELERAVAADSGLALAHLGLGIARIRRGRVDEGREELQIAAALDPDDSLMRSYLGKAYHEERRTTDAGKELATAKELDPADPTPYLYDAIRKRNENRPVEALYDLRESIARNDKRAVYRSRLLLDEDRAVRGSDLAGVFNDLGFEQLGLVTARRSADEDQANYSSHLDLGGNYRNLPGFAFAFVSELLQARIYQPASVNAVRPDAVNETVSFNEYTALFDRPRARAFGALTYGTNHGDLVVDQSEVKAGQFVGTLNGDRFAAALAYTHTSDDGFRLNSDRSGANYHGFFEFSPTWQDSFQVNLIQSRQENGDLPLRQYPALPTPERFDTERNNAGVGYHRILSPGADLAVSAIYDRTRQSRESCGGICEESTVRLGGPQLEVQYVQRLERTTWILGTGGFDGDVRVESAGGVLQSDDKFVNGYGYAKLRALGPFEITLGASYESVVSPSGLFTPRDANLGAAELEFSQARVSPKLGVTFVAGPTTTLRAAGYYRTSPAIGRLQTLEPTQVAGFNQLFEDPGGTRSRSYGFGLDQEMGRHLYAGFSVIRRSLEIPELFCEEFDFLTFTCVSFGLAERHSADTAGSLYFNAAIGRRVTASVDSSYDERDFDFTSVNNLGFLQDRFKTLRIRPQVRVFLPSGFFMIAIGTYYDQTIHYATAEPAILHARFWIGDLAVGYRLPHRYGSVVLDARNVTNREFEVFERAAEDTVTPARRITLSVNLSY